MPFFVDNCHNDSELCLYCVLNFYIDRICKRFEVFTPNKMRKIVNCKSNFISFNNVFLALFPNRIPNNQEDAHEMLIFLLSKLEPPLPKRNGMSQTSNTPSSKPIPLTEIDRIFGGKLANRSKSNLIDVYNIFSQMQ
jgi:Zn-finger protein